MDYYSQLLKISGDHNDRSNSPVIGALWNLPREHFIEHQTERVNIRFLIDCCSSIPLFRSCILEIGEATMGICLDEQTWTVMQIGVPARDFWKNIYFT